MNNQLLICTAIWSIFFKLIDCQVEPKCDDKLFEACYYKLINDEIEVFKSPAIPVDDLNFHMGAKLVVIPPYEFQNNSFYNPFPQFSISFYANKVNVRKSFFAKIGLLNEKGANSFKKGSLLEDVGYHYTYMAITVPLNKSQASERAPVNPNFYSSIIQEFKDYMYSELESFPVNRYLDLFNNGFSIDFSDKDRREVVQKKTGYKENSFVFNLRIYEKVCSEPRIEDGTSAAKFKREQIAKMKDDSSKREAQDMKLMEFFKHFNYLKKIGSICAEIKGAIKPDMSCIKTKEGCKNFLRIEKLDPTLYQIHFFIKEEISYMKAIFYSLKNSTAKYEVTCERYKPYLEVNLVIADKTINAKNHLKDFESNDSLIYSTKNFFYCGVIIPIYSSFKIDQYELRFDLSNQTVMEVEFGSYSAGGSTKIRTWYTQIGLDLQFGDGENFTPELVTTLIFFAFIGGSVVLLCLVFTCWFMKKYSKLSQKLTQAGSRISNLELGSKMSDRSTASNGPNSPSNLASTLKSSPSNLASALKSTVPSKAFVEPSTIQFPSNVPAKRIAVKTGGKISGKSRKGSVAKTKN